MKKPLFLLCFAAILFASCKDDYPIVGKWQITETAPYDESYMENEVVYEFLENQDLKVSINDELLSREMAWEMNSDTLIMYDKNNHEGMPGVMLVEEVSKREMKWRNIILGDLYIFLKRL